MSWSWHRRPCLVTGGSGFGGSHLSAALAREGAEVYVLDRVFPRNSYLTLEGIEKRVSLICGDVRDLELLRLTIERYQIDTIFHLAAQPLVPMSIALPMETFSTNVMGTCSVLEAMRTTNSCRAMVLASSGAYYGTTVTDVPISEDDAVRISANLYSPSKTAADIAVRTYANVYGLSTATCRFMNTYGAGDTNFSRIVPRAIRNILIGAAYDFGDRDDGTTSLDFLHIDDMTNAYLRVAERIDAVHGEAFNFGTGRPVSTWEIARLISQLFGGGEREPIFHGAARARRVVKYLDTGKAERLLGWRATIELEQGLTETIEWYRRFMSAL